VLWTIFERPRVYDGLGHAPYTTDVAVADGRVVAIGDLSDREAYERVAGDGLALAPGFVDVHSHSDELWLVDPRCEGKVRQGVTTEIGGNCGTSPAPLYGVALQRKRRDASDYRLEVGWTTFDAFFPLVEREGVALNVASLVGLGTTRLCVAGPEARETGAHSRECLAGKSPSVDAVPRELRADAARRRREPRDRRGGGSAVRPGSGSGRSRAPDWCRST